MTLKPKKTEKPGLGYFEDSGVDRKAYALILAAYNDNTETAEKIIAADPDQISRQDPYARLTALHIAIFRQNERLVERLTAHPQTDIRLKDGFGRRPADMLDYTTNQRIFEMVIAATYPDQMRALEDEAYEEALHNKTVVPLKPKNP